MGHSIDAIAILHYNTCKGDAMDKATSSRLYETLSRPPVEALKRITGGRLNGKTDINPQWRYKAMTEAFGLCGIGWKYTIDRQWIEVGDSGERLAFVNVSVYVRDGDIWSEAIPGTGGSMLTAKEKNGLYNSDEAFKMATTDALSVALKFLGVASAIYAGQWDGTKYINESEPCRAEALSIQLEEYLASGNLTPEAVAAIKAALERGESRVDVLSKMVARAKEICEAGR